MDLIGTQEAARKWNVSESYVRRLCKQGRIPGAQRVGRAWLIPADASGPTPVDAPPPERLELYLNPVCGTYQKLTPEEALICRAGDLYAKGDFHSVIYLLEAFEASAPDSSLLYISSCILRLSYLNTGDRKKGWEQHATLAKHALADPRRRLYATHLRLAMDESVDASFILSLPDATVPVFVFQLLYKDVYGFLSGRKEVDPLHMEFICRCINERLQPVWAIYAHTILAVYYRFTGDSAAYDAHFNKALSLAVPNRWYTPLAEFSYALSFSSFQVLDPAEHEILERLSHSVTNSYIKTALLDSRFEKLRFTEFELRTAFLLASGLSNKEIAARLNVSLYKVREHINDLCARFDLKDRQEVSHFIRVQFITL